MTRSSLWMLLVLSAACYPWHWTPEAVFVPVHLPREQQVKIWSGDTVYRWHAAIYTRDSITGIPYQKPATCDSCRLALSKFAIDSIYAGYPSSPREKYKTVAQGVGAVVLSLVVLAVLRVD